MREVLRRGAIEAVAMDIRDRTRSRGYVDTAECRLGRGRVEEGESGVPTDAIPAQAPAVRRHGVLRVSSPEYVFSHYGEKGWV